ncbi:hypothetical protein ERJ75_001671900 [Trypanosoma vivax]|nr:BRCT domain-containing protein [Trypanosoma vivax]KAH8605045.1 hypothetical protein ERJ75_001671900 [Trypanosoma vivax]
MVVAHDQILSENTALRLECEAQEAEIAHLRNIFCLTVSRPDLYTEHQRVTLGKCLNVLPEKAWQTAIEVVPETDTSVVIRSLEEQLNGKNTRLNACLQEIDVLKARLQENPSPLTSNEREDTAHLLSQISFLHNEVERLEKQVAAVRETGREEIRKITIEYNEKLTRYSKETQNLIEQLKLQKGKVLDGEDVVTRTKSLENQLATAISEKNLLLAERHGYLTKIRKLEATLKDRKREVSEAQLLVSKETSVVGVQLKSLQEVIQVLSDEKSSLQTELNKLQRQHKVVKKSVETQTTKSHALVFTQTEALKFEEKGCQVSSLCDVSDSATQSVQGLAHMLEIKCAECDDLRAKIDSISFVQNENTVVLETARKRLEEEIERSKLLTDDVEKLSLQVRSLQQKCSQQAATEREIRSQLELVENQKQQMKVESLAGERERNDMGERLMQSMRDMEQLVANKNYCNQQINQLSGENEKLRVELEKVHQREMQLVYSLKAKDGELQEILSAYQNAAKEVETRADAQRAVERELEVVRATLASKEQCVIYLQEQINQLHHRDQQLALDLQTFEYENGQLHRKLVQAEANTTQLHSECIELQNASLAKDRAAEELQQSLAELSKQVVLKENECMLLRMQCESLRHDASHLQSTFEMESRRSRELEDTNARLVVREILTSGSDEKINSLNEEVSTANKALCEKTSMLLLANEQLKREREEKAAYARELEAVQASLEEALLSKERLQRVVLDQAATLSHLSK